MYCNHCNAQIDDGSVICPACNAQLSSSFGHTQTQSSAPQPPAQEPAKKPKKEKTPANPKAKGYAAIASAVLGFIGILLLVIDYVGAPELLQKWFPSVDAFQSGEITWSAYLFGIILCLWMAIVLPAIKPKRPAVTVCICLAIVSLYLFLLSFVNGHDPRYTQYILPICLMLTVSSAIVSILVAYKIIKKGHVISAVGIQFALLSIGSEILLDLNRNQQINLRGSLIFSVIVIGIVLIYEAISYAARINKKQ